MAPGRLVALLRSSQPLPPLVPACRYGPFWVASTLIFVTAATGNLASYISWQRDAPEGALRWGCSLGVRVCCCALGAAGMPGTLSIFNPVRVSLPPRTPHLCTHLSCLHSPKPHSR